MQSLATRDYWEGFHTYSHSHRDFWDWYMPQDILLPELDKHTQTLCERLQLTPADIQVLHVGCGISELSFLIAQRGHASFL